MDVARWFWGSRKYFRCVSKCPGRDLKAQRVRLEVMSSSDLHVTCPEIDISAKRELYSGWKGRDRETNSIVLPV